MNDDNNISDSDYFIPSLIYAMRTAKTDLSITQNSVKSRLSLSLRKNRGLTVVKSPKEICCTARDKENIQTEQNTNVQTSFINKNNRSENCQSYTRNETNKSIHTKCKHTENISSTQNNPPEYASYNGNSISTSHECHDISEPLCSLGNLGIGENNNINTKCSISVNSLYEPNHSFYSADTIVYEVCNPVYTVSFGLNECDIVDIGSKKSALKKVVVSRKNNKTFVDCQLLEHSPFSGYDINENESIVASSQKKVTVNLEMETTKLLKDSATENSKVLILNTNDIKNLEYVIVQPPNCNILKRKIPDNDKLKRGLKKKTLESDVNNGSCVTSGHKKQTKLDRFIKTDALYSETDTIVTDTDLLWGNVGRDVVDMSKKLGVADAVKLDRVPKSYRSVRNNDSPRSVRISPKKDNAEVPQDLSKTRTHSASSHSPRKNADFIQFNLPSRSRSNKTSTGPKIVPHHKIVAGTHFAVDAFSYGNIPNVNHYFLTHFHSDHYCGLKKSFKNILFCSKITADLCKARLGVDPKCIHIIKVDETIRVEDVEVTALDANHCPGAIMLVFTLPNGKTLLHTGDFRATPVMESYAIFWNKDIHTLYLDTTYCNPRYDFPTQDQSLEMALCILREKKLTLEQVGKKFSSVLIICGTYTIGKEKFFLGMARRVGCSVWACPEKDRVLQIVEGRSFNGAPPHSCQLHVVPMRDLTHEKLRSYLDSLQGAFSEVVAFKPSGWENGKSFGVEKGSVTIHGIPYSEHSSFSEMIRFVKFLKPKQVIPTVDISGGVKAVQKYFPCPLVFKEDSQCQSKLTDYFSIKDRQQVSAVT